METLAQLNRDSAQAIYAPLKQGEIRLVHVHARRDSRDWAYRGDNGITEEDEGDQPTTKSHMEQRINGISDVENADAEDDANIEDNADLSDESEYDASFEIHGLAGNNATVCSLSHASLRDNPEFEALSYVWGDQSQPRRVYLNGVPFFVTQNLFKALESLVLQDKVRVVWIDALAINQCDVAERNHQVSLMRDIYSTARQTLIWLDGDFMPLCKIGTFERFCRDDTSCLTANDVSYLLESFLYQEYWSRVWTAQEIRFSRRAVLIMAYGDRRHAAPFQVLLTLEKLALLKLRESERSNDAPTVAQDTCILRDFQTACLMMQPKGAMQHGYLRPIDFQTWIDLCTLRKASDSRDLVFGFWSFLPAGVQHEVPVDYCRPASIVIGACRTAFVKLTNNLEYLQHANYAVENAEAGFPSWEPTTFSRWGRTQVDLGLPRSRDTTRLPPPCEEAFREVSDDNKILHVRGHWLGDVLATTPSPSIEKPCWQ